MNKKFFEQLPSQNKIWRVSREEYQIKRSIASIKSKNLFTGLYHFGIFCFQKCDKIAWSKNRPIPDSLHQPRPSDDVIFFYDSQVSQSNLSVTQKYY